MSKTVGGEVWFDKLPVYIANYNNTLHTTIKKKPIELFRAATVPHTDKAAKTSIRAARTQLEGRAEALTNTENCLHPPISVGDFVRAKNIKGFQKLSGINWTKEYMLYTADGHH